MHFIAMRLEAKGFIVLGSCYKNVQAIGVLLRAAEAGKAKIEDGAQVVGTTFEDVPKACMLLFDVGKSGHIDHQDCPRLGLRALMERHSSGSCAETVDG